MITNNNQTHQTMKYSQASILFLILISITNLCTSGNYLAISGSHVTETMQSENSKWTSAYDFSINADEIVVTINISLLASKKVSGAQLDEKAKSWNAAIATIWNERFYTSINGTEMPIRFHIKFTHHQPHHRVVVHSGNWVPNQHNWYINTPPLVIAHEIGHMLGAYDEYRGGSLSTEEPVIDTTSIMGSKPRKGVAYPRHLALLEKNLSALLKDDQISISQY